VNQPKPVRAADLDEWIAACNEAHLRLCVGDDVHVHSLDETWEQAIARVAGGLLVFHGLGRPRGKLPEHWVEVLVSVAARPSVASDGLVQTGSLRVRVSQLHRSPKVSDP
jgi:hypothetical protein